MTELRGKSISVLGGNVENDIKAMYPVLWVYRSMEHVVIMMDEPFQIAFTSGDNIDTDYNTVTANFALSGMSFANIKIKSVNPQNGFIYTAGS